jgi:DNA-binding NtrC family response regulator
VLLAGDGAITARHLGLAVPAEGRAPGLEAPPPAPPPLAPAPTAAPAAEPAGRDTLPGHRLHDAIAALERARIVDALERCGGNQTRAARMLGVARNTLIARMEKFGLRRPQKD